jgi:hypothetical protein
VPKHGKYGLILRVSNNIHQIPCLESAEFFQEWEEAEKIPVKNNTLPKKDVAADPEAKAEPPVPVPAAEQTFETRMRTKKETELLTYETMCHALPPPQKKSMTEKEVLMNKTDDLILETKALKNELEAYSYEMRNSVDGSAALSLYIIDPTRAEFLADVS